MQVVRNTTKRTGSEWIVGRRKLPDDQNDQTPPIGGSYLKGATMRDGPYKENSFVTLMDCLSVRKTFRWGAGLIFVVLTLFSGLIWYGWGVSVDAANTATSVSMKLSTQTTKTQLNWEATMRQLADVKSSIVEMKSDNMRYRDEMRSDLKEQRNLIYSWMQKNGHTPPNE